MNVTNVASSFIETTFSCYPTFAEKIFGESISMVRDAIVMASSYSSEHWAVAKSGYQCYDIAREVFCSGTAMLPTAFDYFAVITKMCSPSTISCATTDSCTSVAHSILANTSYNFFTYCMPTGSSTLSEIVKPMFISAGVGGISYVFHSIIPQALGKYLFPALPVVAIPAIVMARKAST
jgi:hypothetical protein